MGGAGRLRGSGDYADLGRCAKRAGYRGGRRRNRGVPTARCEHGAAFLQRWRDQSASGWGAMSGRRLLVDAGNTRVKWAVVANGRWLAQGASEYGDWSALDGQLAAR